MNYVRPDLHIDSAALLAAYHQGDAAAMERIVSAHDPVDLVYILVQKFRCAVQSPKMTIEQWVDMQVEKSLDSAQDDAADDQYGEW